MRKCCFACDRRLGRNPHLAICEDEQSVFVGSECWKKIGPYGWKPPKGGPWLYRGRFAPDGTLLEVIGLATHPLVGKKIRPGVSPVFENFTGGAVNQELSEFKARLHRMVRKMTCDLKSRDDMDAFMETLDKPELRLLVKVLNGELHQLREAVLEQK